MKFMTVWYKRAGKQSPHDFMSIFIDSRLLETHSIDEISLINGREQLRQSSGEPDAGRHS
jgi:hypothetical protein